MATVCTALAQSAGGAGVGDTERGRDGVRANPVPAYCIDQSGLHQHTSHLLQQL